MPYNYGSHTNDDSQKIEETFYEDLSNNKIKVQITLEDKSIS
jgi:hypothetical protein